MIPCSTGSPPTCNCSSGRIERTEFGKTKYANAFIFCHYKFKHLKDGDLWIVKWCNSVLAFFFIIIELQLDVCQSKINYKKQSKTCSSSLLGSNTTYPLSARQQQMATANTSIIKSTLIHQMKKIRLKHRSHLPARCFRGIPASTRAAHAAFMAHGRSYRSSCQGTSTYIKMYFIFFICAKIEQNLYILKVIIHHRKNTDCVCSKELYLTNMPCESKGN